MKLNEILEYLNIPEEYLASGGSEKVHGGLFFQTRNAVEKYVQDNIQNINHFDLSSPTIEGESKKIYCMKTNKNIALVELKPTMYSFTHNRYGVVNGTDSIRMDFWGFFGSRLNTIVSEYFYNPQNSEYKKELAGMEDALNKDFPFISNYLGEIEHADKRYAIIDFAKEIPPIEVVWKNYLVGTMKHNLKNVDTKNMLEGQKIMYESRLPNEIVRFDWRNPLPFKDECIPEDFAAFYMNVNNAKKTARCASRLLNRILQDHGYELIDLCYFMNYLGNRIFSEITPDGMRIRKKNNSNESYDKDLWRAGKDEGTINHVWKKLYNDLSSGE